MGRRDRLRARSSQMPTAVVRIPSDPGAWAVAEQRLAAARALCAERPDDDHLATVEAVVAAEAALAALDVEEFTFRTLAPQEWEQLVDAHQPTDEQRKAGWAWNVPEFRPAVLAACEVPAEGDDPLGERGWVEAAEEGELTAGELELLFATVVNLNARQPRPDLGKDIAQTPSSG